MLNKSSEDCTDRGADDTNTNNLYQVNKKRFGRFYTQAAHNSNRGDLFADINMDGAGNAYTPQQQCDKANQRQEARQVGEGAAGAFLAGFDSFVVIPGPVN